METGVAPRWSIDDHSEGPSDAFRGSSGGGVCIGIVNRRLSCKEQEKMQRDETEMEIRQKKG